MIDHAVVPCAKCGYLYEFTTLGTEGCPVCRGKGSAGVWVDAGGCAPPVYVRDTPQEALGDVLTHGVGAWRPGSSRSASLPAGQLGAFTASTAFHAGGEGGDIAVPSRARAFSPVECCDMCRWVFGPTAIAEVYEGQVLCATCAGGLRSERRTARSEQAQRRWRDREPISERQRDQEAIDTIRAYNLACARRASDAAADLRSQRQASAVVGAILLVLSGLLSWWMLATAGVNLGGLL